MSFRLRPAATLPYTHLVVFIEGRNPGNKFINWQQDPFGNFLARVVSPEKDHCSWNSKSEVITEIIVINPFDFFVESYAEEFSFRIYHQLKKNRFLISKSQRTGLDSR